MGTPAEFNRKPLHSSEITMESPGFCGLYFTDDGSPIWQV
jgi:hypothetical protein